jgi:hypothetical protein
MSMKKIAIDLQLHMAVKSLTIFQGEINCKIDELSKMVKVLGTKEEQRENTDYLLKIIFDNLVELQELINKRNKLSNQIENLKRSERNLIKEYVDEFTV